MGHWTIWLIPGSVAFVVLVVAGVSMLMYARKRSDWKKYGDKMPTRDAPGPTSQSSEQPPGRRSEYPSYYGRQPSGR